MSDDFMLPPVPMMTPENARDIARGYKALADDVGNRGDTRGALALERQSHWWMVYAQTLAATKPEGDA